MDAPLHERVEPSFDNAKALRRMLAIAATLGVIAGVTYLVPTFERVRPWVEGEGVPVVRLFTGTRDKAELPDFQGTVAAVANGPVSAPPVAAPNDPPLPTALPPAEDAPAMGHGVTIAPEEYAGMVVEIENPEALGAFYESLRRSASAEPNAITRIAHYGDSSIAADEISHTARRRLQMRFGDAGHGFMLTAKGNMFYGHRDVLHRESDNWEMMSIVRRQLKSGYYGYGGIVSTGRPGEHTLFGTVENGPIGRTVSRFEVYYQRYPNGGELRLLLDGKKEQLISTQSESEVDAWEQVKVPDGSHSLSIQARGEIRMYGVTLERDVPGVVYDALGLVGARAERLLGADPQHIAAQIAHRDPALLVLGFGGNEAGNDALDMRRYGQKLADVIKLMRAGKPTTMSCLLFGPLDQGERNPRGDVVTLRSLPGIVDVQRRVAAEQGCAFFDTYKGMGGQGAVGRWYRARPRLFSPDFRHATPAGYALIGDMYYRALLKGFADHLSRH
ncbi:MAG: GDSL-type esterase/lipase family protein [Polyangiales bacterium]